MPIARFSVVPASYVYLMSGRRVLLQRRRNTGYMDGRWVAGAAGHVELGETAAAAAHREVQEELGVEVVSDSLRPITVMQRTDGTSDPNEQRVDWFFIATEWIGEPRVMEPAKCAEIAWFDLDHLPDPVADYELIVLEMLASHRLEPLSEFGFERG